jgi:hypothetical protein
MWDLNPLGEWQYFRFLAQVPSFSALPKRQIVEYSRWLKSRLRRSS